VPRGLSRGPKRGHYQGRHSLQHSRSASFHTVFHRRRLALLTAPLVTVLAVGVGVATSGFRAPTPEPSRAAAGSVSGAVPTIDKERALGTTRSTERVPLVNTRVPKPKGKLWTTADLDLRTEPREKARTVGLLDSGKKVPVTGEKSGAYAQVIIKGAARWVTADYLSKEKSPAAMGLSDAPCPDGSSIESAIQPQAVKVYRAACAAFPELTTYGGQDGHGEHVNGEAIDFMVPDSGTGQRLADFLYAHHAELDLFDIIWSQHIWTIERAGEGFRSMEDRGSSTANHYDHVHIKIN
jgi:SH3 domain-containing protein